MLLLLLIVYRLETSYVSVLRYTVNSIILTEVSK